MNYPTPQLCGIRDLDAEYNKELERYTALVKEKKEIGELEDIENKLKERHKVVGNKKEFHTRGEY